MESLIQNIRSASAPSDTIKLEQQMLQYLHTLQSIQIHKEAGWSTRPPRWHADMDIEKLRQYYWRSCRRCDQLKAIVEQKQTELEKKCEHVWEKDWGNRDERSRYMCHKCGKSR
jgi:hypothetical protein